MSKTDSPSEVQVNSNRNRTAQAGFTLVELMVAIAVLAILSAMAAPAFQQMIASSRITAATNDILGTLAHARSEAVKRSATVTVSANNNDWTAGWTSTAGGTTVNSRSALADDVVVDDGAVTTIAFTANGQTVNTGSIVIRSSESGSCRTLQILGSGKALLLQCA